MFALMTGPPAVVDPGEALKRASFGYPSVQCSPMTAVSAICRGPNREPMSRPEGVSDEPVDGLTDGLLLSFWRIEPMIRPLHRVKVASTLRGRGLLGDLVRHIAVPVSMDHEGGNVARHEGPIGTISLDLLEEHPAKPKLAVDQQEALTMELLLLSGAEVL